MWWLNRPSSAVILSSVIPMLVPPVPVDLTEDSSFILERSTLILLIVRKKETNIRDDKYYNRFIFSITVIITI